MTILRLLLLAVFLCGSVACTDSSDSENISPLLTQENKRLDEETNSTAQKESSEEPKVLPETTSDAIEENVEEKFIPPEEPRFEVVMGEEPFTKWRRIPTEREIAGFGLNQKEVVIYDYLEQASYFFWDIQNPNHIKERIVPLLSSRFPLSGKKITLLEQKLFVEFMGYLSRREVRGLFVMEISDPFSFKTSGITAYLINLKYYKNQYFLIGFCKSCGYELQTSSDAEVWTKQEMEYPMGKTITHDGEFFYIFGLPEASALKSKDGQNWEKYSINQQINALEAYYTGEAFVVPTAEGVAYSEDGVEWLQMPLGEGSRSSTLLV